MCPNCGGALRKVFGSVGISFKGSGFYKTDSRGVQVVEHLDERDDVASDSSSSASDGEVRRQVRREVRLVGRVNGLLGQLGDKSGSAAKAETASA